MKTKIAEVISRYDLDPDTNKYMTGWQCRDLAQDIVDLIAKELDEVINDNAKKNGNVVPTRHIHDGLGEDIKHKLGTKEVEDEERRD